MRIRNFDCPSCGASLKIKKGQETLSCPYCDSTVIVPDSISSDGSSGRTPETMPVPPSVILDAGNIKKSCSTTIISVVLFIVLGVGAFVFYLAGPAGIGGSAIPVVLEFGGPGMGAGYFQKPQQICVDTRGNIFVGDYETGRIQTFDIDGNYTGQWNFSVSDDIYLRSMALSRDGLLYMIYDGEIYIHDAVTGELVDSLRHPDGWGFDDVEVCDDGSIAAAWYCNRDDIIKFSPDGNIEFLLEEAISGQTGDSELDTDITVDGNGNIFAYGSFNGSVFKFNQDGRFLGRFGSDGDRPGQFTSPSCFCTDPQGRLWVSDFGDLIVFDNNGTYLDTFDPRMSLIDMVMVDGYNLYGITRAETVVHLDLAGIVKDL